MRLQSHRLEKRRRVAREVKSRFAYVTTSSDKAIASVIRVFVDAGWGVSDIVRAIDERPDGSKWPHSGMQGVTNAAHWMKYRLTPWFDAEGMVRPSFAQQELAAAAQRTALDRARREKANQERARRATPAQIRAIRERGAMVEMLREALRTRERELGMTPGTPLPVPHTSVVRGLSVVSSQEECVHGDTTALLANGTPRCPLCRRDVLKGS